MRKEESGFEYFSDILMVCKFSSIVAGYSVNVINTIYKKEPVKYFFSIFVAELKTYYFMAKPLYIHVSEERKVLKNRLKKSKNRECSCLIMLLEMQKAGNKGITKETLSSAYTYADKASTTGVRHIVLIFLPPYSP